jgi:MYXO-CTERM domain-containing protein
MQKLSSLPQQKPLLWKIAFLSASVLATIVSVTPMIPPAAAQVAAPRTGNTTTPATGVRGTGTMTNTDERSDDNSGLWGLAGLVGLLGLLKRHKEEDNTTTRRGDTPVYRDPNIR